MALKDLILKELKKKRKIRVADIVKKTGFSRTYVNRFFQSLKKEGKIVLIDKANRAHYVAGGEKIVKKIRKNTLNIRRILKNIGLSESVVLDGIKRDTGIFLNLPKNVVNILNYGFTEMLNNAIEHSRSGEIAVTFGRSGDNIDFEVIDFGIGIFNNIMKKRRLKNELEAIQDLLKGKQTTAPEEHTGEGIFFTSAAADKLIIRSSRKKLIFENQPKDVFIKDVNPVKGTRVRFEISKNSKRNLTRIFKEYSGDAFKFSKTKVVVGLYEMDDAYISRSQARRVLSGLDKFKTIVLDFKGVETVGQSFADEVFRVWQHHHPAIKIVCQNANENILFMIKRSLIKE